MHNMNSSNPWSIIIGGEQDLNFVSYVGCALGVLRGAEGQDLWPRSLFVYKSADSLLVGAWNEWWDQLVQRKVSGLTGMSYYPLVHPPGFDDVEHPVLRQHCAELWPSFMEWWNIPAGGQMAMMYWESAPQLQNYIYEFEQQAGREIHSFNLNIDLVYGILEPVEPVPDYVILPASHRYVRKKDWWLDRFRKYY